MKRLRAASIFIALLFALLPAHSQQFAKFFNFGAGNPFSNVSFINGHELKDSTGFLILADRYTTYRSSLLIKTDTNLQETWSKILNFQQSAQPFDNINFIDIGELPNGNYYTFGMAGPGGTAPHYILFVFDTSGQVIQHVALHDSQNITNGGNYGQIHFGPDSSIIIAFSEYERFGYYRLDQQLNLLSYGFYSNSNPWGRDCIMLHDTSLIISSADGLTKTTSNGTVLWSKSYGYGTHITSLYESPSGFLYAGGIATSPATMATFAKFDANGNPLFLKEYQMVPSSGMSAIWNIFPCDDHLMLYSDSVLMVADTNGTILGLGKTMNSYNYKFLKSALGDDFLVTGLIFQDSTMNYEYTLMKFDDSTSSGCLHPRAIQTISPTINAAIQSPLPLNVSIVSDTIGYTLVAANLNYDPLNGCPPSPLGEGEENLITVRPLLYPNPAINAFTYSVPPPHKTDGTVNIYNSLGQIQFSGRISIGTSFNISADTWPEGLYYLQYCEGGIVKDSQSLVITH